MLDRRPAVRRQSAAGLAAGWRFSLLGINSATELRGKIQLGGIGEFVALGRMALQDAKGQSR
eukprot:422667-Alexandrium_andersonii.AAC.1